MVDPVLLDVNYLVRHPRRRALVHCQVNFRASSMPFRYRLIIDREKPEEAHEAVARVWVPDGA